MILRCAAPLKSLPNIQLQILRCSAPLKSTPNLQLQIFRCSAPLNSKQTFCYKYSVLCTFKLYSKHSASNITVLRTFLFRYSVNHPYPNFPVQIYYCYDKKQQSCEIFVETEPSSIIQGAEHRNIIHI